MILPLQDRCQMCMLISEAYWNLRVDKLPGSCGFIPFYYFVNHLSVLGVLDAMSWLRLSRYKAQRDKDCYGDKR